MSRRPCRDPGDQDGAASDRLRVAVPAESTSFIAIHRQMLVVQHQFAEQLDLLDLVIWWRSQPLERLCLDTVDLGLELRNFRQCLGCWPPSAHSVTLTVTAPVIKTFIQRELVIGYPLRHYKRQSVLRLPLLPTIAS
jgi:hypothetical protein